MNLQETLQGYLHYTQTVGRKSLAAIHFYAQDLQEYPSWLQMQGKTEVESILSRDIQSFLSDMEQRDIQEDDLCYKHSSANHMLSSVYMFYRLISMSHSSIPDPLIHLRGGKEGQKLSLHSDPHDIGLLPGSFKQDVQGLYQRAILEPLCGRGFRVSEVCELRINQVRLEQGYLRVIRRGDKERMVPMHERCMRILYAYLTQTRLTWEKRKNTHVLLNSGGDVLTRQYVHTLIKQCLQALRLDKRLSAYSFRHSFTIHLLDGGIDLWVVQELLGHSGITIAQIYTHV